MSQFQWPRGLRRRSAVARLLWLWFRIPPGAWMFVCCECRVLLGRGLCDELITCPEESYRLWLVIVCDLEISWMRRPWPTGGLLPKKLCESTFLSVIPDMRKSNDFLEVRRLCLLVLLITVYCRLGWIREIIGVILTGKPNFLQNTVCSAV